MKPSEAQKSHRVETIAEASDRGPSRETEVPHRLSRRWFRPFTAEVQLNRTTRAQNCTCAVKRQDCRSVGAHDCPLCPNCRFHEQAHPGCDGISLFHSAPQAASDPSGCQDGEV